MMNICNSLCSYAAPAGRIIVGAFFLLAGVGKIVDPAGTAAYIASVGMPMPEVLAWMAALFLVAAGGAMIANYRTYYAAKLLVLFTLVVSFLFHGPQMWADDASGMQHLSFMKNMAILGGLLVIAAYAKAARPAASE